MIEQRRLGYLSALGIDNYIPRRRLSAAAPSPLRVVAEGLVEDTPNVALTEVQMKPVVDTADAPARPVARVENTTAELLSSDIASIADTSVPHSAVSSVKSLVDNTQVTPSADRSEKVPAGAAATSVRFALNIWSIADKLLIVDSRQVANALPTERLLQNILWRLGYPLAQLPQSEILRWPLFKNNPSLNDADEAGAMVQAYLQAQCAKAPGKTVLLMGHPASRFGFNDDRQREYGVTRHEPWQATVVVSPSLVELLHEPLQKALLWELLCPLLQPAEAG
ncbi:MAG: hypothetical protein KTR20_02765 [Cellvibrionaceae bacterium]|nr:hypothetical protein [Cellvibrionaceae bacterium]